MMRVSYHRFGDGVNLQVCNPMRGCGIPAYAGMTGVGVGMMGVAEE